MRTSKTNLFVFLALLFTCSAANAADVSFTVDCKTNYGSISPYVFGYNTSGLYYSSPTINLNQIVINKLKEAGITMLLFPPGSPANRYDFKYNNYKGRHYPGSGTSWTTTVPSIEDELRFCNAVGAEPLIKVNTAFIGPNGTGTGEGSTNMYSDDFAGYAGVTLPDNAVNRAQYAADMVTHVRQLCNTYGWKYPVYYEIGNEWRWNGVTRSTYAVLFEEYSKAMKAVDPNIKLLLGCDERATYNSIIPSMAARNIVPDIHNYHIYAQYRGGGNPLVVYCPGTTDGTFTSLIQPFVSANFYNVVSHTTD